MSIEVNAINKSYGREPALKGISFKAPHASIVGFLGPNGAGKSTMMKLLTTYLKPDSGTITIDGFDTQTDPISAKQNIGYLPEHNPLYGESYVLEYLNFIAGVYKISNKKDRIHEVIEQTGLTQHYHKKIKQLSKGYRQRVGLAAGLIHDPNNLILDEPTTGLDPNQLVEIRELIKKVAQNKTILFSTHIMQEVDVLCDRILLIHKGTIVADTTKKAISEKGQTLEEFFKGLTT